MQVCSMRRHFVSLTVEAAAGQQQGARVLGHVVSENFDGCRTGARLVHGSSIKLDTARWNEGERKETQGPMCTYGGQSLPP